MDNHSVVTPETKFHRLTAMPGGLIYKEWWECGKCGGQVGPYDFYCKWCGVNFATVHRSS